MIHLLIHAFTYLYHQRLTSERIPWYHKVPVRSVQGFTYSWEGPGCPGIWAGQNYRVKKKIKVSAHLNPFKLQWKTLMPFNCQKLNSSLTLAGGYGAGGSGGRCLFIILGETICADDSAAMFCRALSLDAWSCRLTERNKRSQPQGGSLTSA